MAHMQSHTPEDGLLQLIVHAAAQQGGAQRAVVQGLAQGGRIGALQQKAARTSSRAKA